MIPSWCATPSPTSGFENMTGAVRREILILTALGFVSGVLTTLIWLSPGGTATGLDDFDLARGTKLLMPGLLFGLFLAVRLRYATALPLARLVGFALLFEAGWLAAYFFAFNAASYWDGIWHELAEIGFAAGLIGGLACGLGGLLLARPRPWLPPLVAVTATGALAGVLLAVDIDPEVLSPLFYVWQAAVAAAVAWTLGRGGAFSG